MNCPRCNKEVNPNFYIPNKRLKFAIELIKKLQTGNYNEENEKVDKSNISIGIDTGENVNGNYLNTGNNSAGNTCNLGTPIVREDEQKDYKDLEKKSQRSHISQKSQRSLLGEIDNSVNNENDRKSNDESVKTANKDTKMNEKDNTGKKSENPSILSTDKANNMMRNPQEMMMPMTSNNYLFHVLTYL